MINRDEFEQKARIFALENAIQFDGKANPKALIGKTIAQFPEMKQEMATYVDILNAIVENINSISLDEQTKELKKINPSSFEKKEPKKKQKDGLPELTNTDEEVVVRFEPAPSGYLHIGHLFGLVANYEIKRKYNGKIVLRIADTNPDNISIENYEKVIEDVKWICEDDIDTIEYQSHRLPTYYKYLTTLIETNYAYVCQCDGETFKAYTDAKEHCPHAKMSYEEQKELFTNFMDNKIENAVIRFRTDITHKNPALRTFSLARINTTPHPNVEKPYHVWPTMNLAVAVDDVTMGITHVIRGKDHEINMERQKLVQKALGMKSPEYFHFGRMKFKDLELSKSKLSKQIEEGTYSGWDDPRVPSLCSYRKRGFHPKALRNYICSLGISKRDSFITSNEFHKGLYYHNKQIIEPNANHYFFVSNPENIHITNINEIDEKEISIKKHPDNPEHGWRSIPIKNDFLINSEDFENLSKGDKFRLMHFGNFEVIEKDESTINVKFLSKNYDKKLNIKKNIHYVSKEFSQEAEIILQDATICKGLMEKTTLTQNECIQFERFGFVKYDHKNQNHVFYFTHP